MALDGRTHHDHIWNGRLGMIPWVTLQWTVKSDMFARFFAPLISYDKKKTASISSKRTLLITRSR